MGFFSDLIFGKVESRPFSVRLIKNTFEGIKTLDIQIKGSPYSDMNDEIRRSDNEFGLNLVIAFGQMTDKFYPLFTDVSQLTNGKDPCVEFSQNIGPFPCNAYWPDWITIWRIIDDELCYTPPFKNSNIECSAHIFLSEYNNKLICSSTTQLNMNFSSKGYLEIDQDQVKIQENGILLAAEIAKSDGRVNRKEGNIIKEFAKNIIENEIEMNRDKVKNIFNSAIEKGLSSTFRSSSSFIDSLCREISSIDGYLKVKMDIVELCLDVMVADDVAEKDEIELLERIADKIDISYEEFLKIREKRMIGLNELSFSSDTESIENKEIRIGINSKWSKAEKIDHCKKEFRKWNGRLSSLSDEKKRQNAQKIIDSITELIDHYKND